MSFVHPVARVNAVGSLNEKTGAVTEAVVGASSVAGAYIPINYGAGGYTAYVYSTSPSVADLSVRAYYRIGGAAAVGANAGWFGPETIAAAGSITGSAWFAFDFTPHATTEIFLHLHNADAVLAANACLILAYGGE